MRRDDELTKVEAPKGHTNPTIPTQPNLQNKLSLTVIPIRQSPPDWVEYRRCVTYQGTNEQSLREENPIDKLIIKGIKSITTKEFEKM